MTTKDCKTIVGYIAFYSKTLESFFKFCRESKEKDDCRKCKDSAKKLDKALYKLMGNVKKRRKGIKWSKDDYKDIDKIRGACVNFEESEKTEYINNYKDMRSCYYGMEESIEKFKGKFGNGRTFDKYMDVIKKKSQKVISIKTEKLPLFEKGSVEKLVEALDPKVLIS